MRIPKSLCSGREVNKKLMKQYVHCIQNVYDVVDSDFLEVAKLLQLLRKFDFMRGLFQLSAYEICKPVDIAVSLSTMLSTKISSSAS